MNDSKKTVRFSDKQIEMAHGAGGLASQRLFETLFLPLLENQALACKGDAGVVEAGGQRLALTTDSFVVRPLEFAGGSIGELAVNGTVNDLAVSGARPLALAVSFILEEGVSGKVVETQARAVAKAAERAGVAVIAGDTKVVERGKADGMYLTTSGIGFLHPGANLSHHRIEVGDRILLSGPIGDHGITVLLARGDLQLDSRLRSDTRPLTPLVAALLDCRPSAVKWMRDPTRGGLASALNEAAQQCSLGMVLEEESIPVRDEVRGACEILGLDPLQVANEGQFAAVVSAEAADDLLQRLRSVEGGEAAVMIGEVQEAPRSMVACRTPYGGTRIIQMLTGDPLPRIC